METTTWAHPIARIDPDTGGDARRTSPEVDLGDDPWRVVGAREPRALEAALARMSIEHVVHRGAPRDLALATEFLRRHLPAGRLLLHGAGSHSRAILPTLEALPGVKVVGVIDKLADTFDDFLGHPVVSPEDAAWQVRTGLAARVLLSNTIWEMSMRSTLLQAGIPTERIQGIYGDPRYQELGLAAHGERAAAVGQLPRAGCEFVLVDFERQGQHVIDDETLAGVLPPERSIRLFSERFDTLTDTSVFPSFGFGDSLILLVEMLRRLAPRVVYLRTFMEDNLTGAILRRLLPGVRMVHEIYDWSVTVEPSFLRGVHGHDERSMQMALTGELASARQADFVISKRGGPAWRQVAREIASPDVSFFPQVDRRALSRPRITQGPKRLVYAGNLPAPNTLDRDMVGTLFPLFESLSESGDLRISVFNGMHRGPEMDAVYAHYRASANEHLLYHGALPYDQLVRELEEHDYGWLYFPRDGIDFADERVLISNKFTGYVCAGLPVLVDDGWEYMASLVQEFDAGIVLPMREPERLLGELERSDPQRHRAGALALREFMIESNARVVDLLRERFTCGEREEVR